MQDNGLNYEAVGTALLVDVAAVSILAFGIYLRRHRRRDLVMAFTCLNVALFVVVQALTWVSSGTGLALGFGLFAALSIVRLRSEELSYREVAYFFSALALAIVNGLALGRPLDAAALSSVVLGVMWAVDRRRAEPRARRTALVLDEVFADEATLRAEVGRRLAGDVVTLNLEQIDYVRELTRVDVRYFPREAAATAATPTASTNGHASGRVKVIGL